MDYPSCNVTNNDTIDNILIRRCDCHLPTFLCYIGNVAGLCSTVFWFFVLLPQVYRCLRHRSVEGLSLGWAVMNFTAALNNAFFVFKLGGLPLYSHISAIYMPVLEAFLLLFFVLFARNNNNNNNVFLKWVVCGVLCAGWAALIVVQSFFDVYQQLEWLSIALWSAETFPQVWLNTRRRSTHGLSTQMIVLTTLGKTTDFISTYVLVMPMQYIIMAFFSSSVAIVQTLQVIWYWNQLPPSEHTDDDQSPIEPVALQPISARCHTLRVFLLVVLCIELGVFVPAIVWRAGWFGLFAPAITYSLVIGYYVGYWYCWGTDWNPLRKSSNLID